MRFLRLIGGRHKNRDQLIQKGTFIVSGLLAVILTVIVAMIPILEMPAGITVAMSFDLPASVGITAAVVGTLLQIVFAFPVIDWAYRRSQRFPRIAAWLLRLERKTSKHRHLIVRYGWLGLAIFTVLPLPGSGVWGGAVLGRLLQVPVRAASLGLLLGVGVSATLVGLGLYGVWEFASQWF